MHVYTKIFFFFQFIFLHFKKIIQSECHHYFFQIDTQENSSTCKGKRIDVVYDIIFFYLDTRSLRKIFKENNFIFIKRSKLSNTSLDLNGKE